MDKYYCPGQFLIVYLSESISNKMAKYLVSAIVVMSFSLSILGAPQGVEPNLLRYSYDTNEGDEGYKFK